MRTWLLCGGAALGIENTLCGGRKLCQLDGRTTRTSDEFTTTVWTKTAEHVARTSVTESAFEGADARLLGVRWQVAVAALAVRA